MQTDVVRKRSFIFLQGPTSGVFQQLGLALRARGHQVTKINLCPGDFLFWRGQGVKTYRGTLDDWPTWLTDQINAVGATDIIYFADRFPYHKAAQIVARRLGVRAISMEYGYLRPDWLILEEGGQSTYSHFTNDPESIITEAAELEALALAQQYDIPQSVEAFNEAGFHLSNALFRWLTPRYRPNRYYHELIEFPAYLPRLLRRARNERHAPKQVARIARLSGDKFLAPLQMQNDYQLRDNAPPGFQARFIEGTLASFASHAAIDAQLIFKLHPMDNGLEAWDRFIAKSARDLGITDRVHFLDGGDLAKLFEMAAGCIVTNSTMGLRALRATVPVKVMGVAVYDIPGLTHQGALDVFWTDPEKPDPNLRAALVRCMAHGLHVRGTVYGKAGRDAFVRNAIERLEQERLTPERLHMPIPPRLAHARALGIAVDWAPQAEAPQ